MVTIQVFYRSTGNPAKRVRVAITEGWADGVYEEYTDDDGEAHFPNATPRDREVYVDGAEVFKGRVEGRKIVYI